MMGDILNSDFSEFLLKLSGSRVLIFDLDNTIYQETDFLFYAYHNISVFIEKKYGCKFNDVYSFLVENFLSAGREQIFEKLKSRFGITDNIFIPSCLEILRGTIVSPLIAPFKYFADFMNRTTQQLVFIITNGNPLQQKNKVSSINWGSITAIETVYANLYSPKPSPSSYFYLKKKHKLINPVYIGDSEVDFIFAKRCSIDFVKVFEPQII